MTLIVSLRIPDGIVLAGDSLSTLMRGNEVQGDIPVTCPNCNHSHVTTAKLQGAVLPATSLSFAQKIFPFLEEFGVGTAGAAQLLSKTVYFAMRELEQEVKAGDRLPVSVREVAALIGERAKSLLHADATLQGIAPTDLGANIVSFQVVGYENGSPETVVVEVGADVAMNNFGGAGCTVIGQRQVVRALWGLTPTPEEKPMYELFSLQDAITYAEFLISATASHQRFLRTIPTVGGDIDVALVTPFDHFKWIRQKTLFSKS